MTYALGLSTIAIQFVSISPDEEAVQQFLLNRRHVARKIVKVKRLDHNTGEYTVVYH